MYVMCMKANNYSGFININAIAIDNFWIVAHIWNAPYGRRHVFRWPLHQPACKRGRHVGFSQRVSVPGSHEPAKPVFSADIGRESYIVYFSNYRRHLHASQ